MSAALEIRITTHGLAEAVDKLNRLAGFSMRQIGEALGTLGARQLERRVRSEKTSPDGAAWKPSRDNANTLVRSGRFAGSMDYQASDTQVAYGSTLNEPYPAVHQSGAVITPKSARVLRFFVGRNAQPVFARKVTIPARPWLGLSAANENEMLEELQAALDALVGGWR